MTDKIGPYLVIELNAPNDWRDSMGFLPRKTEKAALELALTLNNGGNIDFAVYFKKSIGHKLELTHIVTLGNVYKRVEND